MMSFRGVFTIALRALQIVYLRNSISISVRMRELSHCLKSFRKERLKASFSACLIVTNTAIVTNTVFNCDKHRSVAKVRNRHEVFQSQVIMQCFQSR